MASDEPESWRQLPLNEVAGKAMSYTQQAHRQADVELQRRMIEESSRASRRLLTATWVIVALTAVIAILTAVVITITILQLVGVLD